MHVENQNSVSLAADCEAGMDAAKAESLYDIF